MVFTPGFIWGQQGVSEYTRRATGEGKKFREHKKTRVSYKECGTKMSESLLHHHMECAHRIFMPQTRGVDFGGGVTDKYVVSLTWVLTSVYCLVGR